MTLSTRCRTNHNTNLNLIFSNTWWFLPGLIRRNLFIHYAPLLEIVLLDISTSISPSKYRGKGDQYMGCRCGWNNNHLIERWHLNVYIKSGPVASFWPNKYCISLERVTIMVVGMILIKSKLFWVVSISVLPLALLASYREVAVNCTRAAWVLPKLIILFTSERHCKFVFWQVEYWSSWW